MKLIELLNGNTELKCGVISGDIDCPDIVWYAEDMITNDGYDAWKDVLDAEAIYDKKHNVLIVDNVKMNRVFYFCWALNGYVCKALYNKWFNTALNYNEWDN